jgi:TolB protein
MVVAQCTRNRRDILQGALRRVVAAAGATGLLVACDASPITTLTPVAAGVSPTAAQRIAEPTLAASPSPRPALAINVATLPGKLLFVGDANLTIWEKGATRKLTSDRISRQPTWSPDGTRIAHVKLDVNSSEVWVTAADGTAARQLTRNESRNLSENVWAFRPAWWPDGSKLLFLADATSNDLMVWEVGVDGRNLRQFVIARDFDGGLDRPNVTADGKTLIVMSYRGGLGKSHIWAVTLPNGPWKRLSEHPDGAYDPAISPDGRRIAYVGRAQGSHDIWVMNLDGGGPQRVTHHGAARGPCWSPDGQYIAYAAAEGNLFDLWVATVPTYSPTEVVTSSATVTPRPRQAPETPTPTLEPTATPALRTPVAREVRPIMTRQVTKAAELDALSGVSWTA